MNMYKVGNQSIDGLIPGTKGQRAFPTQELSYQSQGSLKGTDPFIMLDHIGPSAMPNGWKLGGKDGIHPHRGFETITFMFKGNLYHLDTVFSERPLLTNGSVQQMNAGKGIRHGGDFWADESSNEFHEVQLWINNPAHEKMSEPYVRNYSAQQIKTIDEHDLSLRVIAGQYQGITGPVSTFADIRVLHGCLKQNIDDSSGANITLNAEHSSQLLFVMTGALNVHGQNISAGETLVINDIRNLTISGESASQFLLISGDPLQQPYASGGPFVMNTQEQIQQAYNDVATGVF